MKKYIILMFGIFLMTPSIYSQTVQTWTETFDGSTISFSATPANAWVANSSYYVPGSSGGNPKSYHGLVPNMRGDSTVLLSPVYDCRAYSYVILQFSHICKISPQDIARIEYRTEIGNSGVMTSWDSLPGGADYLGDATNYNTTGFNAASYSDWKVSDSTEFPAQSWWKEEIFDLSFVAESERIQFRFVIKRGQVHGTQTSYGWLIDNFQLRASTYEINPPQVNFMSPYVRDTVYGTGPWEINAKVRTATNARIETPWLVYTSTLNGVSATDSVQMTNVRGDSLWKANIPKFEAGSTVTYSILGRDTTGNQASALSSYVIKAGTESDITIGTGTSNRDCYTPIGTCEEYAWNRMLYLASELGTTTEGKVITSLEFQSYNFSGTLNNQKCYVWEVTNTTLATGYIDPVSVGATEVFSGTITFIPGWNKVSFSQPFYLTAGKNLQVYWENKHGVRFTSGQFERTTATNMAVDAHGNANNQQNNAGALTSNRGNTRFNFLSTIYDNSVALSSIDLKDSISVAPGLQTSIPVTIKNKGSVNLTSATVYYSVNGGTSQLYNWSGDVLWDFDSLSIIGTYQPKLNGWDTLKVWVSMPNGAIDSLMGDDTLTKVIYGSSDILMSFVDYPEDTMYITGPFEISAKIYSLSGAAIGTVSLNVITTYEGMPTTVVIPMVFDPVADLWKASIPQTQFSSDIVYSITITDGLGNVVTIENSFYLKGGGKPTTEQVIIGTGSLINQDTPIHLYHFNSWSKQLYLESEIPEATRGATINKLAWSYATTTQLVRDKQRCYMRLVDDVDLSAAKWNPQDDPTDPANEMTLVWGMTTLNISQGWVEITLDQPFVWKKGKNLLIYWYNENNATQHTNNCNWNHTTCSSLMVKFTNRDQVLTDPNQATKTDESPNRPNVRLEMFYIKDGGASIDTSVALVAIENPLSSGVAGASEPVRVKISNRGTKHLTECTIEWTKNGQPQASATYSNVSGLPEGFSDTITIGSIIPLIGQRDTIVVWVSMPNGILDSITDDDTLKIITLGCSGNLTGTRIVGPGGDFTSLADALAQIRECSLIGDLTLQLKGPYAENVDLTGLTPYMRGYSLTITSLDNDPDSATIQPASGVGITLGNTRNIVLKNITVNTASSTASAIQFTASCTNIVIRDCKVLVNPTTGSDGSPAPIYKGSGTGTVDSIFMIHNLLDGGSTGLLFYGGSGSNTSSTYQHMGADYGTNVIFDSNTCRNSSDYALRVLYTDFLHISYNDISPRASSTVRYDPFSFDWVNGNIIGNSLRCSTQRLQVEYFHLSNYHLNNTLNRGLITNNQVIHTSSANTLFMYHNTMYSEMVHNSFYVSNNTTGRGIYWEGIDNASTYMRNNNFVINSPGGYLFAQAVNTQTLPGGGARYDIDYCNFYHSTAFTPANLANFKNQYSTAQNVVSVVPDYIDISVNTNVKSTNTALYAPLLANITDDIEGKPRTGQATMGAYQIIPLAYDLSLNGFVNWDPEVIKDQTVPVTVEVQNFGTTNVQSVVLGWSVNGQTQPSCTWTPTTPLPFSGKQNVNIGTFSADTVSVYNITVWVDSVNNNVDLYQVNDTIRTVVNRMPLVEWTQPFAADTVNTLTFDIHAKVRTATGAPIPAMPEVIIETVINGAFHKYDTVPMVNELNGLWKLTVPQQYYGSNVIYSMTVSDTAGNTETIVDSTYIQFSVPFSPYLGYDLTIMSVASPVNNLNELCTPDYSPLQVALTNLGTQDYDFSQDPISLFAEIINPFGQRDTASIIVNTGLLLSTKTDTIEVIPSVLIKYSGVYQIKAWLTSSIDYVPYDDTLISQFVSGRVSLPIDEDFSGATMPAQFILDTIVGLEAWKPYTDTSGKILPPEGNGMLRYVGTRGTMTHLSTRQLDLFGAVDPKMEFWYYHDTATSDWDNSYTEVRVIVDGVIQVAQMLYRKKGTTHGWEFYTVDLKPYTTSQCVFIQFESMNKYDAKSDQYLAHIFITSTPDLAVSKIIISPEATVCDLTNKEVRVVLSSMFSQEINFNRTPTNLAVKIGSQQLAPYTLQKTIFGNMSDTVLIASNVDLTGITSISASLTSSVDNNPLNDSTSIVLDFRPSLSVSINPVTNMNNRISVGVPVWQEVIIENTGNVELSDIELVLRITGTNQDVVRETLPIALAPNAIDTYQFVNSYIVPADERYQVSIIAYLGCDSAHVNDGDAIDEYVDMHNLSVVSIDAPPMGQQDTVGTALNITVSIRNTDDLNSFERVPVHAVIESEEGVALINLEGTIAEILPSETIQYTFEDPYTVPADSIYRIRVYIDKVDNYQGNDTTETIRETVKRPEVSIKGIDKTDVFTLGQNIPNPANNRTRIDYSIPEEGVVIFHVHSISGQLLYAKTIEAAHGKQSIELNTNAFAAGIYFYSIEYKGQRLVKRMMISGRVNK